VPEVGVREVGVPEVGAPEVGARELGVREVGARELGVREVGAREVGAPEVGARERCPSTHRRQYLVACHDPALIVRRSRMSASSTRINASLTRRMPTDRAWNTIACGPYIALASSSAATIVGAPNTSTGTVLVGSITTNVAPCIVV